MKKHPAAIARDEYFADKARGKPSCNPTSLCAPANQRQYLTNRLHAAFVAGYDAAVEIKQKEIDTLVERFADQLGYKEKRCQNPGCGKELTTSAGYPKEIYCGSCSY